MRALTLIALAILSTATAARAAETEVKLAPGPGLEQMQTNCNSCHSLDYVQMNSPFPSRALWEAELTKMIKVFGATVDDADAKAILEYLVKNYGS